MLLEPNTDADNVYRDSEESISIAEKLGDLEQLGLSITVRAMLRCFLADYEIAGQDYQFLDEVAGRSENMVHRAWAHSGRGECLFRLGRYAEAIACFHKTLELLADMEHRTEDIRMNGMLAAAYWRLGERDQAWEFAQKTLQVIAQGSYATVSTLEGFDGVAEVCLERWLADLTNSELRRSAELAGRHLRWYAKVYPIGRPRWLCYQGRVLWALGKHAAARRAWNRALGEARRLALPLEEKIARSLLDSWLPANSTLEKP